MTRFNHDEALRRFLNSAQATTFQQQPSRSHRPGKPQPEPVEVMGVDYADAEARIWTHYVDGADLGREQAEGIKRAFAWDWDYASGGGCSWWTEFTGKGARRGIAYPNGRGVMTPLIDGKTGDIVEISKADQYAAGYGKNNDAARVMKAMERFNELPVIR